MTFTAFILIASSAILHATWNLFAKRNQGAFIPFYAILTTVAMLLFLNVLFWTPVPLREVPSSFWWYTLCSTTSDSIMYSFGLMLVYRHMDMSSAYPVMRALPIILTGLFTTIFGLGACPGPSAWIGFLIVFSGALLMPLTRFSDFKPKEYLKLNSLFLLLAACGTTGYTVFDSQAQKVLFAACPTVAPAIRSLTYYSCREIFLSSTMWLLVLFSRENRKHTAELIRNREWTVLAAGICAPMTYILVLFAMNYVSNVSYVQVFRQIGLPIGMIFGCLFLKEHTTPVKWVGVSLILIGLIIVVL